jgi:murein DD-endopeptidase MepM/ murein hydrolase activator NlpD
LSVKFPRIVFLGKEVGIFGLLLRIVLISVALVTLLFLGIGIYFLKEDRELPKHLYGKVEIVKSQNQFLAETIKRISPDVGRKFFDSSYQAYSKLLYSVNREIKEEEHLAVDLFSMSGLLEYSQSVLEYFEEIAKNVSGVRSFWSRYPLVLPFAVGTKLVITRPFSQEMDCPFSGNIKAHNGIDVAAENLTPILAPADGEVIAIRNEVFWGRTVRIRHADAYETFYAHLGEVSVRQGQRVGRGDLIGLIGESGWTTHPHLHYEITKNGVHLDPLLYNFSFLHSD